MCKFVVALLVLPLLVGHAETHAEKTACVPSVRYSAPDLKPVEPSIDLQRLDISALPPFPATDDGIRRSDQATVALKFVERPEFNVPGPWSTRLLIRTLDDRQIALALNFHDHANQHVRLQWLNEKLLFIRVWWGRIVSTDLILDVERGEWLYVEEASYGELIQSCPSNAA